MTHVGQLIPTKLLGRDSFFGMNTSGDIKVTDITSTGYSIKAMPGHPDSPGRVAFNFSKQGDDLYLTVSGSSQAPIPGGSITEYNILIENVVWRPYANNVAGLL